MKKTRLNHAKVNAILSEREIDFDLPGGIKSTPVRMSADGKLGLSDFNRFYVTEAVKAYLGMPNEFNPHGTLTPKKLYAKVIDTLKHYDLLIETDYFYDLFLKSSEVKNDILTLENGDILENQAWDNALNKVEEAYSLLDSIKDNAKGAPLPEIISKLKEDLKKVGENSRLTYEELIEELSK